jgi:hypothetical protein
MTAAFSITYLLMELSPSGGAANSATTQEFHSKLSANMCHFEVLKRSINVLNFYIMAKHTSSICVI